MVNACKELYNSYNAYSDIKDQWENVSTHTHKGIGFLENYAHFIRDRSQVETEYARNLRRLVKTYLPKKKDDEAQFSYVRMFREALNETGDLAGQHEVISENLTKDLLQELNNLIKETKEERKKLLSEGTKVQQQLQQSIQSLEKSKKNYEKAFKEAEKAQENYIKADADLHLSRAEVEKQRMNASIKNHHCEDFKNEYANQLQKTNQVQSAHYHNIMPTIFNSLQQLDEKRITYFKHSLKKSVDIERSVFPIIEKCLDGVVKAANGIDEQNDTQIVVEKYKSGFTIPSDIPFDDLSTARQNGETTPIHHIPTRQDTIKGTISASKLKKRVGLLGIFGSSKTNLSFSEKDDFSDLPPNQKKKKIQHKLDELSAKLQQENAAREGLLKMKEVYSGNPSLGDPATITGQLSDSNHAIEKLQAEIERYRSMMEESDRDTQSTGGAASGGPNTPTSSALGRHPTSTTPAGPGPQLNGGGASPRSSLTSHRTSLSDESLSRSSHSPESGIGLSHNSLHGSDTYDQPDTVEENEEFEEIEPLPVIGYSHALYQFDATSEGSMPMAEGEKLYLIELDQGDGWTRVRRLESLEEGFVPTTYIQITLDNNC